MSMRKPEGPTPHHFSLRCHMTHVERPEVLSESNQPINKQAGKRGHFVSANQQLLNNHWTASLNDAASALSSTNICMRHIKRHIKKNSTRVHNKILYKLWTPLPQYQW